MTHNIYQYLQKSLYSEMKEHWGSAIDACLDNWLLWTPINQNSMTWIKSRKKTLFSQVDENFVKFQSPPTTNHVDLLTSGIGRCFIATVLGVAGSPRVHAADVTGSPVFKNHDETGPRHRAFGHVNPGWPHNPNHVAIKQHPILLLRQSGALHLGYWNWHMQPCRTPNGAPAVWIFYSVCPGEYFQSVHIYALREQKVDAFRPPTRQKAPETIFRSML